MKDADWQAEDSRLVLVVGAGINGAAVARELALNGVGVIVVDAHDIAFGATSRSSRLIHGGLRYLERGDIGLVRESLREREILLKTAPDFVKPLRLRIPVRRRSGGLVWSGLTFFGWDRTWLGKLWLRWFPNGRERGRWLVQLALWFYERLAGRTQFEGSVQPSGNPTSGRWLCEYTDAQILSPERFTVALLRDAQQLASETGQRFEVLTHTRAELAPSDRSDPEVRLIDSLGRNPIVTIRPCLIVNATGAAGDATLADWQIASAPLFGGTKGSHFVTEHARLRGALGDAGLYAEAGDGRMVFVLPFGPKQTLIGTTDEPYRDRPELATASDDEISYLLDLVNSVLPGIGLTRGDVAMSYSGVRPLPFSRDTATSAVPRGHWIAANNRGPIPVLTLVGGKLTTCRALAEEVADQVLAILKRPRRASSRTRSVSERHRLDWQLPLGATDDTIRAMIRDEWVRTLSDLVERRLMLIFTPELVCVALRQLVELLAEFGVISRKEIESEITSAARRLRDVYGINI